jgi:hypothetical protein
MSIGGWGGWNYAVGSTMLVHNSVGEEVVVYCILDSDYFLGDELADRYSDAERRSVSLHIWLRKEIENYLLDAEVISRFVNRRKPPDSPDCLARDVKRGIDRIVEALKDDVIYGRMERIHLQKRNNVSAAHKAASAEVEAIWRDADKRWQLVSGKEVLGRLSGWTKGKYGVSFGANALARSFEAGEIDPEVIEVVSAIQEGRPFSPRSDRDQQPK